MARTRRLFQLHYLTEYQLGRVPTPRRRNVTLQTTPLRGDIARAHLFDANYFGWHITRRFEGREDSELSGGVWPINALRCDRRFGNPGMDLFPQGSELIDACPDVYEEAFKTRLLCYHRAANAVEAFELINSDGTSLRYSSEVTSEWYDPPKGRIDVSDTSARVLGTHAVPLIEAQVIDEELRFIFPNSWGKTWGDGGFGSISAAHFNRIVIESWNSLLLGFTVPYEANQGLICLEWKWGSNEQHGLHVREIVDAATGQRLAWAFCKRRGEYLDVEEFFVWPTERRKGYGRQLAHMVSTLASDMRLPLRTCFEIA